MRRAKPRYRKSTKTWYVQLDRRQVPMDHDYPGNVRELENIIEHAFVASSNSPRKPTWKGTGRETGKTFTCGQCVQTAADAVFLRLGDGHVLQRPTECNR